MFNRRAKNSLQRGKDAKKQREIFTLCSDQDDDEIGKRAELTEDM
jgi:hypothetical protein